MSSALPLCGEEYICSERFSGITLRLQSRREIMTKINDEGGKQDENINVSDDNANGVRAFDSLPQVPSGSSM